MALPHVFGRFGRKKRRTSAKRIADELMRLISNDLTSVHRASLNARELKAFRSGAQAKKLADRVRNELQRIGYPALVNLDFAYAAGKLQRITVSAELIAVRHRTAP